MLLDHYLKRSEVLAKELNRIREKLDEVAKGVKRSPKVVDKLHKQWEDVLKRIDDLERKFW
jgi:acyl carrier protein phosphodiesterase